MFFLPSILYLLLCGVVAYRGRQTQVGFLGAFLLSIFLTPIIVFIGIVMLTPPPGKWGNA
jgi:hypothetical protein